MKRVLAALVGVAGIAASASAQTESWVVTVLYGGGGASLSPANPVARIRVTARFDSGQYLAFGAGLFDMAATEPGWVGSQAFPMMRGPNITGTRAGASMLGVVAGQLHNPPSILADPANPIIVWEMNWTTANFSHRSVGLSITTRRFGVFTSAPSPVFVELPPGAIPGGQGSIAVTPAPSGFVLLGVGGLVLTRHRR